MTFWIRTAAIVTFINAITMVLAYVGGDWFWFTTSWLAASAGGLGWMFFKEEHERMCLSYRDLALRLRWEIREEGYRTGQALPTIGQLADRFRTTRSTVRRALQLLENEDIIEVVHGKGSYVLGPNGEHGDRPGRRDEVENYIRHNAALGLPIERTDALAVGWSVSPSTVRRVVAKLINQGVIRRRRGGGFESA